MSDLENKAEELGGKAKEFAGDVADDKSLENEGKGEQVQADAKQGFEDAKNKIAEGAEDLKNKASEALGKLKGDN